MPRGKGTYGSKFGRPKKKAQKIGEKIKKTANNKRVNYGKTS